MENEISSPVLRNVSLKQVNTFGLVAEAAFFCRVDTVQGAREALLFARQQGLETLILGGGSNILFTRDFPGLVIQVDCRGYRLLEETASAFRIRAGAGQPWHEFVMACLEKGWYGLENLSLIPGTTGAAPMQNIGAYGAEVREFIDRVHYLNLDTLQEESLSAGECAFGYRDSVFKNSLRAKVLIWSVDFLLLRQPAVRTGYGDIQRVLEEKGISSPSPRDVSDAVVAIRSAKLPDPALTGNAGSFFKNPLIRKDHFRRLSDRFPEIPFYPAGPDSVKIPAGWLIERAGWKGHNRGTHGVHDRQALVLVNYGGATGAEILLLSRDIQADIQARYGIELQAEVNVV